MDCVQNLWYNITKLNIFNQKMQKILSYTTIIY
jgi:hypothetical protein